MTKKSGNIEKKIFGVHVRNRISYNVHDSVRWYDHTESCCTQLNIESIIISVYFRIILYITDPTIIIIIINVFVNKNEFVDY